MKSDDFKSSLIAQYREQIQEAVYESETDHKTSTNLGKLNSKLKLITKSAKQHGLTEATIDHLIEEVVPKQKVA